MPLEWRTLQRPPSLAGLYARAAMNRSIRGHELPDVGLRCWLSPDPEQVSDYRAVCGFDQGALVPPTYLHVLAFPLQMALIADKAFALPLLGLVHLHNRIRVVRPLGGLGGLQVCVHAQDLRAHEKGAVFTLVTQVHDPLGPLWEEQSTMLCRGMKLPGPPAAETEADSQPLTEVAQWPVPTDIGRRYARVSGDYNPIHLSAASAKLFGFPTAIAHGMWTKARAMAALSQHLPIAHYEIDVEFQQPIRLPSAVILSASLPGASGQLSVHDPVGHAHMRGHWKPLD